MVWKHLALLATTFALTSTVHAQWKFSANRYDLRVASTETTGVSPDGPVKAKLSVLHSPGKDGTISIELIVKDATKMKGFGFNAFEGPDAPAANLPLATIAAERAGAKPLVVKTKVGGWYLDQAFHFSASEKNTEPGEVLKAVRAIQAGAAKVVFSVQDSKDAKKHLRADVATTGAADALGKLLK